MKKKIIRRTVGWRIPADLIETLNRFGEQTNRTTTASAITLIERGVRAAIESGEYTPNDEQADVHAQHAG